MRGCEGESAFFPFIKCLEEEEGAGGGRKEENRELQEEKMERNIKEGREMWKDS